jgi:transcriptional regulator with XRE-family HTH domain
MATATFGQQLADWRRIRHLSQLSLAASADVSQRHISFLETGRSKPSPEMVVHLGLTLQIAPRQVNTLLAGAGYAPKFSETAFSELGEFESALAKILTAHEPNVSFVIDRHWNILQTNATAARFIFMLLPDPPAWAMPPNVLRLSLHPEGLRQHLVDWKGPATALLQRISRSVAANPHDSALSALLEEVSSYAGIEELSQHTPDPSSDLVIPLIYRLDGIEVEFFTTISTVGDATDLTLSELRIETLWPATQASSDAWEELLA